MRRSGGLGACSVRGSPPVCTGDRLEAGEGISSRELTSVRRVADPRRCLRRRRRVSASSGGPTAGATVASSSARRLAATTTTPTCRRSGSPLQPHSRRLRPRAGRPQPSCCGAGRELTRRRPPRRKTPSFRRARPARRPSVLRSSTTPAPLADPAGASSAPAARLPGARAAAASKLPTSRCSRRTSRCPPQVRSPLACCPNAHAARGCAAGRARRPDRMGDQDGPARGVGCHAWG
jgi:hypothetical protein